MQPHAERARDELDRAIVVRRAEPARDSTASPSSSAAREYRLELGGLVADDRDPRRLEAEAQRLPGEERPVEIGSVAAHELAARDDDHRARAAQPFGTTTCVGCDVP